MQIANTLRATIISNVQFIQLLLYRKMPSAVLTTAPSVILLLIRSLNKEQLISQTNALVIQTTNAYTPSAKTENIPAKTLTYSFCPLPFNSLLNQIDRSHTLELLSEPEFGRY